MKSPDRESCLRIRGPLVLLSILFGFSGGPAFAGNSLTHYEIMESLGFTGNASEAVAEAEGLLDALDTDRDQNLSFDEWAAPFPYGDLFLETLWESFNTNQDDVVSLSEWTNLAFLWSTEPADESTTFLLDVPDSMANIRINELQWVGSHNSYHIRPDPLLDPHYFNVEPELTQSIRYSHPPLWEQFSVQGIRQIELDILADPIGGLYADPWGPILVRAVTALDENLETVDVIAYDAEELVVMQQSGLKVLHLQDLDYASQCKTLRLCLTDVKDWSQANPGHQPIFVLVEAKDEAIFVEALPEHPWNNPPPIDAGVLSEIDTDILAVFDTDQLLMPSDVRGDYETLREAVLAEGWPTLAATAGKIYFGLDNGGTVMDTYLALHPELSSQILFTSSPRGEDRAAFMKRNDPYANDTPELAELGYLIRTRADYDTVQSVNNDPSQRDQAFASGAHFISTDYRVADLDNSPYSVGFENDAAMRCNPISGTATCSQLIPEPAWGFLQVSSLLTLVGLRRSQMRRRC